MIKKGVVVGYDKKNALLFDVTFSLDTEDCLSVIASIHGQLLAMICGRNRGDDIYDRMPGNGGHYTNWYDQSIDVGSFCRTYKVDNIDSDNDLEKGLNTIFKFLSKFFITYQDQVRDEFICNHILLPIPDLIAQFNEVQTMLQTLFSQQTKVILIPYDKLVHPGEAMWSSI